jgi:hypothetical protein
MIRLISLSIIISVLFASCAILAPQKEQTINPKDMVSWSDTTKLTWNDFQGQPIKEASFASELFVQYNAFFQKPTMFLPARTTVECYVDKRVSWALKGKATVQLLLYNQTLFDLYELYARKLRKKFSESNFGIADPAGVFQSIYQANSNELSQMISQYRTDTIMGANNKLTKEWSAMLAKELKDLDEYKTK